MPGHVDKRGNYITVGCTFDQGFVWENHHDALVSAQILGDDNAFLKVVRDEVTRLDPIIVGESGQIKEYREERFYSDIGDKHHRHISHLCGLYPGTLINSDHKDWLAAASKTLDLRGNNTTGWAMAHRMNCRARLKEGEKAYEVYQKFIRERTVANLWTLHPPFQIDGNFGTMAGVAEMLLQSHETSIEPLPALPAAWKDGHFNGLVARGNFVVSAKWKNGVATSFKVTSRAGGICQIQYPNIGKADIENLDGSKAQVSKQGNNRIAIVTRKGDSFRITAKK